jgi:hypothetical protein
MNCFYHAETLEGKVEGKWSSEESTQEVPHWKFTGTPGPTEQHGPDPLELFLLFIPITLMRAIVANTNAYIAKREMKVACEPTTLEEFMAFVGMNIYRGVVNIGATELYWAADTAVDFMRRVMPRDRFQRLNSHWHVSDPNAPHPKKGQPGHNVWHKVQSLIDQVNAASARLFYPDKHLTVDEQMVPFEGRFIGVKYMKGKPTKWGLKVYAVACAKTGYILKIQPYAGKSDSKGEVGWTDRLVMTLCKQWLNKNHIVVADNHFSSISLVKQLYKAKTGYAGTLQRGRAAIPKELFVKKNSMKRGQYIFRILEYIIATAWQDRKLVFFLCTCCPARGTATVKRWTKKKERIAVQAPPVLGVYQPYMRGVDMANQQLSSFRPGSATKRWWVVMAWHCINLAVHNAYIMHKSYSIAANMKPLSNSAFRLRLATQLIGGYSCRVRAVRHSAVTGSVVHRLVRRKPKRDCSVCCSRASGETRVTTRYVCDVCNVYVCPLCYDKHRGEM